MGMLFVVALIVGALVATGLAGDIATGMKDAICRITGGDCDSEQVAGDPERCLLSSTTSTSSAEVFVAFVEIGKESTLVKEVHSDGSVTFTLIDNDSVAGQLFAGGKARIGRYGASVSAEASAGARLEGARVFEFPDEESAAEFEERVQAAGGFDGILRDITHANDELLPGIPNPHGGVDDWVLDQVGVDDDRDLPEPDATYVSGEAFVQANGDAGAGLGGIDGELAAAIEGAGGVRHYTSGDREGESEVFIELEAEATGTLISSLFGVGGGLGGDTEGVVTLTLNSDLEPTEFSIQTSAGYTGSLDLAAELQGKDAKAVSRLLEEASVSGSSGTGQQIDLEGKLDMTDPENREAVLSLLNPSPSSRLRGALAVARRLDEDGTLTIDTSTTSQSEGGAEVKVGLGVGGGGGLTTSQEEENRTAGFERPPGGTWAPRVCKAPPSP
jgi:hypothetical protein